MRGIHGCQPACGSTPTTLRRSLPHCGRLATTLPCLLPMTSLEFMPRSIRLWTANTHISCSLSSETVWDHWCNFCGGYHVATKHGSNARFILLPHCAPPHHTAARLPTGLLSSSCPSIPTYMHTAALPAHRTYTHTAHAHAPAPPHAPACHTHLPKELRGWPRGHGPTRLFYSSSLPSPPQLHRAPFFTAYATLRIPLSNHLRTNTRTAGLAARDGRSQRALLCVCYQHPTFCHTRTHYLFTPLRFGAGILARACLFFFFLARLPRRLVSWSGCLRSRTPACPTILLFYRYLILPATFPDCFCTVACNVVPVHLYYLTLVQLPTPTRSYVHCHEFLYYRYRWFTFYIHAAFCSPYAHYCLVHSPTWHSIAIHSAVT